MAFDNGTIVSTGTLPLVGTERVIRDSRAWWEAGDFGTREKTSTDYIVGHWTAGHPHTGVDTGFKVVSSMKARKRKDGSKLEVGIHFVIGADGRIFQTAPLQCATVHCNRPVTTRSIGVECAWPGTTRNAEKLGLPPRAPTRRIVRGRFVHTYPAPQEMFDSWAWLVRALCGWYGLPLTRSDGVSRGVMEHFMVPRTSKKVDAAGLLLEELGL